MSEFIKLNTVIGNGKSYVVPKYQRDYSWGKDDWEDLWNDIMEIPQDKNHYLGYLVLQPIDNGEESYWVIDGQQRLITCSLIALAVTALLKEWSEMGIDTQDNETRYKVEKERYLGNFSASKLTMSSKLVLNKNNDDYYKSWLLNLRRPKAISRLKPSEKLLQQAFDYFHERLTEKFGELKSGAELVDFLEKTVGNGLEFTAIHVKNDLDAFKVFETLNARGVKLSPADLLKNFLFSQVAQSGELDLEEAERRWQNISDSLQNNELTTYLRYFWNSKYKIRRQPELFKAIKKHVSKGDNPSKNALDLLNDLENQVAFYAAFKKPHDDVWTIEETPLLSVLKLLEVSTCYPLMLAVIDKLDRVQFKDVLREIVAITLRYNLSGLNPNEAERQFSNTANEVSDGKLTTPQSITSSLKSIYVDDDQFQSAFTTLSINTRRKKEFVKYLLVKIENQISGSDIQYEEATATIEHILPVNPGSVWEVAFPHETQDEYIYRVGNYTLLPANINNKLDNETSFQSKLEYYKQTNYKLSNEYCLYDEFNPETLTNRQKRMAKVAKSIWKSKFL